MMDLDILGGPLPFCLQRAKDSGDLNRLKTAYAEMQLRSPHQAHANARALFGDDIGTVLHVTSNWPTDPEVLAAQQHLLDAHGEEYFMPSRSEFCARVWQEIGQAQGQTQIALMKIYADTRGWTTEMELAKMSTKAPTIGSAQNVMVVVQASSDEEWQRKVQAQQRDVVAEGKRINEQSE